MSKIPTPTEIPPTPQQINATLGSVISAAQALINEDHRHFKDLKTTFLQLYSHPTFQLILGILAQSTTLTPPPNNRLTAELSNLKSTISALSRTVTSLQPKMKGASPPPPPHPPPPQHHPTPPRT